MSALEETIREIVRAEVRAALAEMSKPSAPQLVTIRTYAEARSISQSTVRAAIREGRLPAVHVGRAVRIPADAEIGRPHVVAPKADTPATRADRILGVRR